VQHREVDAELGGGADRRRHVDRDDRREGVLLGATGGVDVGVGQAGQPVAQGPGVVVDGPGAAGVDERGAHADGQPGAVARDEHDAPTAAATREEVGEGRAQPHDPGPAVDPDDLRGDRVDHRVSDRGAHGDSLLHAPAR
jgi:hypothetical protein